LAVEYVEPGDPRAPNPDAPPIATTLTHHWTPAEFAVISELMTLGFSSIEDLIRHCLYKEAQFQFGHRLPSDLFAGGATETRRTSPPRAPRPAAPAD
jgi:hypothetical protein